MVQLSLLEKLEQLLNIVKSSSLFTILAVLMLVLITFLIIDYKKNKTVNEKAFIAVGIMFITFIVYKYNASLLSITDNFFEELVKAIYFPNIAIYSIMLVFINTTMVRNLLNGNSNAEKIASVVGSLIINFLFLITLDVVVKENIDVYEKLTVYSNKQLLSIIELTSIIFTIWSIVTVFIKLVNRTINSNVEVPVMIEQSVKEIPAYVIPEPVNISKNTYVNEALSTSFEANAYTTLSLTPAELYDRFKQGEELTKEQYIEIKNYLMTK